MNDGAERNTIYDDITVKVDAAAKSYGIHVEDEMCIRDSPKAIGRRVVKELGKLTP